MSTVEDRLVDALAARAQLETVTTEALAEHREEVRDAVEGDVTPVDRGSSGSAGQWVLSFDEVAALRRRRVTAVLAAAAAAVLAVAALGVGTGRLSRTVAPAASWAVGDFAVLATPQAPGDALPSAVDPPESLVAASVRRLAATSGAEAWIGTTDDGEVCLVLGLTPLGSGGTATGCGSAEEVERGDWVIMGVQTRTARLVPDGTDPAGAADSDLVPLTPNLWVDYITAREGAVADLEADAGDSLAQGPYSVTGSQNVPPVTEEGDYAVLVRCLTTEPVVVAVNGTPSGSPLCSDGWHDPVVHLAAVGSVRAGTGPMVVTASAATADARYAVAVVRGEAEFQDRSGRG